MISSPLSRRRFLAIAGGAAGAVALAPLLSSCEASPPAGPSAYSTPGWPEGIKSISGINANVLAAAGGLRLQQTWGVSNKIDLVDEGNVLASFGTIGNPQSLNFVSDATFVPDGTIWVVDRGNRRLLHFDQSLRPLSSINTVGGKTLRSPSGIEALSDGRIAFTDSRLGVGVFSSNTTETHSGVWISPASAGSDSTSAVIPKALAVGPGDVLAIQVRSNGSSSRLHRLNSDGSVIAIQEPPRGVHTSITVASTDDVFGVNASTQSLSRIGSDDSTDVIDLEQLSSIIGRSVIIHNDQKQSVAPGDGPSVLRTSVPVRITTDRTSHQVIVSTVGVCSSCRPQGNAVSETQRQPSKAEN